MVDVAWSATSPHSGRFDAIEWRSEADAGQASISAPRGDVAEDFPGDRSSGRGSPAHGRTLGGPRSEQPQPFG